MTSHQQTAAWRLPFIWIKRIRLARNAVFSLTQILVGTLATFWMYRRSAMSVGLSGLGAWSVTSGLVSLLTLADLGMTDAMVREVARFRAQMDWAGVRRAIVSCSCYVGFAVAAVGCAVYPLIRLYLNHILHHDASFHVDPLILSAVAVLAINTVYLGLLGAIEGFEHYHFRLIATAGGSISLVASSFFFLHRFGTLGIAFSFMTQAVVNLLVAAFILWNLLPAAGPTGARFSVRELRRLSKIGVPIRLGSLVNLTYEPITRLLIARFGGIESAGTYEAAVRCGIQSKALIVGCVQVVLPRFSLLSVNSREAFRKLLQIAYRMTGLLVIGVLPLMLLAMPIISFVLLGRLDERLQLFAEILSFGWLVNALAVPPSYANLADGKLFWNWFCNVCASIVNPAIGLILGPIFEARGVVVGTACALVSMTLMAVISRRLTSKDRIPRPGAGALGITAAAVILVTIRHFVSAHFTDNFTILSASAALCVLFAAFWLVVALRSVQKMVHEAGVG
jgi:O-antigen/teichoic acid export membrane protein